MTYATAGYTLHTLCKVCSYLRVFHTDYYDELLCIVDTNGGKAFGWWGWVKKIWCACMFFYQASELIPCVPFYKGINVSSISQPFCFNTQHDLLFSWERGIGIWKVWVLVEWYFFWRNTGVCSLGLIECAHREAL